MRVTGNYNAATAEVTQRWTGAAWATPPAATAPPARAAHALTYDAGRGEVVLFGGQNDNSTARDDTWLWDGGGWLSTGPHVGWGDVLRDITTLADTALALSRPRRYGWILLLDEHDHRDRAQLYLAATLVDNHSGELLWHAHRTVEPVAMIDAVARDIRELMAELPAVQPSPAGPAPLTTREPR